MIDRKPPWSVSLFAFGLPSDPRTFSGYAQSLHGAIASRGALRHEFDAKQLRIGDVLRGAVTIGPKWPRHPLSVSHRFAWSERGSELLSVRLDAKIRESRDRGAFLQMGTLLRLADDLGPHYMLTDMTIPQARRAGQFAIATLSPVQLAEAEQLQTRRLHEAQHIFTLSEWSAASVVADCGVSRDRITVVYAGSNLVIPNGVCEARRDREILFVGIDWKRKGGPVLLEAFNRVRRHLPDATLTIVGCAPSVRDEGVHVEGFLDKRRPEDRRTLARCYLRASCFCLPTVFDPFPNAIVEAAGVGLPIVAVGSGSRGEAVVHGQTGLLIDSPDPTKLADALIWTLEDPERCRLLGLAAREHAHRHFTWPGVVDKIGARLAVATESQRCPVFARRS